MKRMLRVKMGTVNYVRITDANQNYPRECRTYNHYITDIYIDR